MKKISFRALKLTNFKNFKNKLFIFGEEGTSFAGANGSGKTTMIDAVSWLLTGKDSKDRANVEFLPLGKDGQIIHDLPASVELKIDVDGNEHKLRRTLSEVWTKKRRSSEAVLTGRSNSYEFDEAPIKTEKDFNKLVNELFDVGQAIMVSRPDYFPNMEWKAQREMLLKLSGFKDEDVIAQHPEFKLLEGKNLELVRAAAVNNQKETVKSINEIAIIIKTINETLPANYSEMEGKLDNMKADLEAAKAERKALLEKAASQTSATHKAELQIEQTKLQMEMDAAKKEYENANKEIHEKFEKNRESIREKIKNLETGVEKARIQISAKGEYLSGYKKSLDKLRKDYVALSSKEIEKNPDVCPTCGQKLTEEQQTKIFGDKNAQKAEQLKQLEFEGKEQRDKVNKMSEDIKTLENSVEALNDGIAGGNKQISELDRQEKDVFDSLNSFEETADYKDITKELEEIAAKIKDADTAIPVTVDNSYVDAKIDTLMVDIAKINAAKSAKQSIADYQVKQEDCTSRLGEYDAEIATIDDFVKTRCEMISEAVNKKFDKIQFKLFDNQINGGVKETCELTMNGTPYRSLSTAEKTRAGMEVIKALQTFFGLDFPIFVDNRESITDLPDMETQIINLFVNAEYKEVQKI